MCKPTCTPACCYSERTYLAIAFAHLVDATLYALNSRLCPFFFSLFLLLWRLHTCLALCLKKNPLFLRRTSLAFAHLLDAMLFLLLLHLLRTCLTLRLKETPWFHTVHLLDVTLSSHLNFSYTCTELPSRVHTYMMLR
jgi:hypothetical protein